jgi:hypothetical protein
MKKIMLLTVVVLASVGIVQAKKVTLISPNGGETLVLGSPLSITWSYSGFSGNENLAIALESSTRHVITEDSAIGICKISQGSFTWLVGEKMDRTIVKPGSDYFIYIEVWENDAISDLSDKGFTIVAAAAKISLMTPNGGETLEKETDYDINWSFAGKEGLVSLTLLKNELPLGLIAENLPATSFRYHWHIGAPLLNGAAYPEGGNYRVLVQWQLVPTPAASARLKLPALAAASVELLNNSDRSDGLFFIRRGREKHDPEFRDKKR